MSYSGRSHVTCNTTFILYSVPLYVDTTYPSHVDSHSPQSFIITPHSHSLHIPILLFIHNLVQVGKARPPLKRNVGMKQLFVLCNITSGKDFKAIFIVVTHHASIGCSFLARVVKWAASRAHTPSLVGSFLTPRKNVGTSVAVKSIRQTPHDALFNQIT